MIFVLAIVHVIVYDRKNENHWSLLIVLLLVNTNTQFCHHDLPKRKFFVCQQKLQNDIKNSLIIHAIEKKYTCLISVFICDKTLVHFHKTFASIFSACTTSILKILS